MKTAVWWKMGSLLSALGTSSKAWLHAVWAPPRASGAGRLARLADLISAISRSDSHSESLLAERFAALAITSELSEDETRAFDRLRDLMELRSLAFGQARSGRTRLLQGFLWRQSNESTIADDAEFSAGDIAHASSRAAELLWKLLDSCQGTAELQPVARKLYYHLFGKVFETMDARRQVAETTDKMQSESGIPFLLLNFLNAGALEDARWVGRGIQVESVVFEEPDRATALYWMSELAWFRRTWGGEKLDFDSSLRYLYHICFSAPERAGFLEIDGHYVNEFEAVNELAREAFSYRETLTEQTLDLWKAFEGNFDGVFQQTLETLAGKASKVIDRRPAWEKAWKRSQSSFSRDYLLVIEGNLCYLSKLYADAAEFFEQALAINPELRVARMNLLFSYARMGNAEALEALVEETMSRAVAP
ncbi:hypothetical protein K2X33_09680, partial [bacterium]|nr:hypothetical protein [bacterium]